MIGSLGERTRRARQLSGLGSAVALLALAPTPAATLIIDRADGQVNTSAPPDDPGWRNVARLLGGPSLVYLGDGWVITAKHVGAGIVEIDGQRYDPIAGSLRYIVNEDGTQSDLLLFRIEGDPDLPRLALAASPPRIAEEVILVGHGASRGLRLTIGSPPLPPRDGFHWVADDTKRWGTNRIGGDPGFMTAGTTRTHAIATAFDRIDDPAGTRDEAHAALGDSGGALFARADRLDPESDWVLAGIMTTVSSIDDQPSRTSFYGDLTFSADLSYYREQILGLVRPICLGDSPEAAEPDWACGPGHTRRTIPAPATGYAWLAAVAGVLLLLALLAILRRTE